MRVLLTNDDGIGASGLQALRRALLEIDGIELHVIAPDSNRSATARSITTRSVKASARLRVRRGSCRASASIAGAGIGETATSSSASIRGAGSPPSVV